MTFTSFYLYMDKLSYTLRRLEMTNINDVVEVVDILLKSNRYENAAQLVDERISKANELLIKLRELKKEILRQETNVH